MGHLPEQLAVYVCVFIWGRRMGLSRKHRHGSFASLPHALLGQGHGKDTYIVKHLKKSLERKADPEL